MGGVADSLFIQMAGLVEVVVEVFELDVYFLFFCISQTACSVELVVVIEHYNYLIVMRSD